MNAPVRPDWAEQVISQWRAKAAWLRNASRETEAVQVDSDIRALEERYPAQEIAA